MQFLRADVGIGSPGSGQVFIYFGGRNFPLLNPQIIGAEEIISQLSDKKLMKGFGSTLSGNSDLDGNNTPGLHDMNI